LGFGYQRYHEQEINMHDDKLFDERGIERLQNPQRLLNAPLNFSEARTATPIAMKEMDIAFLR
jgi:hypothetical protein